MLTNAGTGYGAAFGAAFGFGNGYGSGYGSGYGYGYGCGYGDHVCTIDGYDVCIIKQWGCIVVGCQIHHVDEWRKRWRGIADDHGANITAAQVEKILQMAGDTC